jgi:hypothetical protein
MAPIKKICLIAQLANALITLTLKYLFQTFIESVFLKIRNSHFSCEILLHTHTHTHTHTNTQISNNDSHHEASFSTSMLSGSKFDIDQNTVTELRVECDDFLSLLWFEANMKFAVFPSVI